MPGKGPCMTVLFRSWPCETSVETCRRGCLGHSMCGSARLHLGLRMLRSLLFVPGDSERKLSAAANVDADALILDLEDAVADARKAAAREFVGQYLCDHRDDGKQALWVRINGLETADSRLDLETIVPAGPVGIVLPKCSSPDQVRQLAETLDVMEARSDQHAAQIGIIPVVTETPEAVFKLGTYTNDLPRLKGLTWGAEDLSVCIGAHGSRDDSGQLWPVFRHVRSMVLLAAAAAAVQPIETVYGRIEDADGLIREIERSRREGFTGMLAIHPRQVPAINSGFCPTAGEIDQARRIVQAFADAKGAGAIRFDGRMLDQPHLAAARRLLAMAET